MFASTSPKSAPKVFVYLDNYVQWPLFCPRKPNYGNENVEKLANLIVIKLAVTAISSSLLLPPG